MLRYVLVFCTVILLCESEGEDLTPYCSGVWTGYYDDQTLAEHQTNHPGEICDQPINVDVKLMNGQDYSTSGENVTISASEGFSCKDAEQVDGKCKGYKVRYCCPRDSVPYCSGYWTKFFSQDTQDHKYDFERLDRVRAKYPGQICQHPTAIDARLKNGDPFSTGQEVVFIGASYGIVCKNSVQKDRICEDYKVRFCCPHDSEPKEPYCDGKWTEFYNRDDADYTHDDERLNRIRKENPDEICDHPIGFDARLVNDDHYTTSGEVVAVGAAYGLTCQNSHQHDGRCEDYKIRFCCPEETKEPYCDGQWTPFFDEDDPTNGSDSETLDTIREKYVGQVCENPTAIDTKVVNGYYSAGKEALTVDPMFGLLCKNEDQCDEMCEDYAVRFCCPKEREEPFCDGTWTVFYDQDDPSDGSDKELLSQIQKNNSCVCEYPIGFDARLENNQPYTTSDDVVTVGQSYGIVCDDSNQKEGHTCQNYKIRFCCKEAKEHECPEGYWTEFFDIDTPYNDHETLSAIREVYPHKVCIHPSEIDARLLNDLDYTASDETVTIGPGFGLLCQDEDQHDHMCEDYKVRFWCDY